MSLDGGGNIFERQFFAQSNTFRHLSKQTELSSFSTTCPTTLAIDSQCTTQVFVLCCCSSAVQQCRTLLVLSYCMGSSGPQLSVHIELQALHVPACMPCLPCDRADPDCLTGRLHKHMDVVECSWKAMSISCKKRQITPIWAGQLIVTLATTRQRERVRELWFKTYICYVPYIILKYHQVFLKQQILVCVRSTARYNTQHNTCNPLQGREHRTGGLDITSIKLKDGKKRVDEVGQWHWVPSERQRKEEPLPHLHRHSNR